MKRILKKTLTIVKGIVAGLIGTILMLILGTTIFALLQGISTLTNWELTMSGYNIIVTLVVFGILGFVYGIISFRKKNYHYKIYRPTVKNIVLTLIVSGILTWIITIAPIITNASWKEIWAMLFLGTYIFCSIIVYLFSLKKKDLRRVRKSTYIIGLIFNPVFIIIFITLFNQLVFTTLYTPCGVVILGTDKNVHTDTWNVEVLPGEHIVSIDGRAMNSLRDVRTYISDLPTTKEIQLETETNIYYLKTYMQDDERYMGLVLKQDFCVKN